MKIISLGVYLNVFFPGVTIFGVAPWILHVGYDVKKCNSSEIVTIHLSHYYLCQTIDSNSTKDKFIVCFIYRIHLF